MSLLMIILLIILVLVLAWVFFGRGRTGRRL